MNGDDKQPQEHKRTNPRRLSLQSHSFSSLPDEIAENILARVSRCNYPSLSLVSKRMPSLLSSPELYKTRSLLRTTEPCLYLCLKKSEDQPPKWFTLWMKPIDETLTEEDNHLQDDNPLPRGDYSLFPLPSPTNPTLVPYYFMVAVGTELYVIGGSYEEPSSAVRILDCRSHTWRDGPSMLVARKSVYAVLLDEKIYVMGRRMTSESLAWIEVLDIKTQTWRHVQSHGVNKFEHGWFVINVFEGKMYALAEEKSYAYDPQESTWEVVDTHRGLEFINDWCVIDDVMYCFTISGYCMWYDSETRGWINVKGSDLEVLRTHRTCSLEWRYVFQIRNLGGKLIVMWIREFERDKGISEERRLWCAKIALEKRGNEVWGKIEWVNSVSQSCWFSSCVVSI